MSTALSIKSSPYLRMLLVAALVFLTGPLFIIFPVSFTPNRYLSLPQGHWSLVHYYRFFTDSDWLNSTATSLSIAIVTSLICALLATTFAIGVWLRTRRSDRLLFSVILLPMVVPQIISSMVIFFFESKLSLLDSYAGLVLAHSLMAVPYSLIAVHVSCFRLDRRLEHASRSLGAQSWQTALFVVLPNIRFGVLTAAFLAFILSWEEVVVTLFISGMNIVTLPKRVWDGLRYNLDPVIAATAVLMMSLTIAIVVVRAILLLKANRARNNVVAP